MRINDYCGKCVHVGTCNTCPDIIEQDAQGDIFACRKFQSSENTPENVDSKERVNENEPKNIDSFENKEVSRRDKIASIQAYCISTTCNACVIREICDGGWSRNGHINAAYELIKENSPVPMPGTATSATHYQLLTQQPIEIMQRLMTHEQFVGFLWGNVIKYALRRRAPRGRVS